MLRLATAVVLLVIGWSLWERRLSWGALAADRVATFSCINGAAALVLFRSHDIGDLAAGMGVPYLHCVIGDMLLMAAVGGQIYSAACHLVTDDEVRVFMHRIDVPAAIAAQVMLMLFFTSSAPRRPHADTDLLTVPCDMWMRAYWLVYCGTTLYMAGFLAWLLLLLRQDSRSRWAPNLMLASAAFIGLASADRIVSVLTGGCFGAHGNVMRACMLAGFAWCAIATAQSWRQRVEPFRHRCADSAIGGCPHGVEPRSR